MNLFSARTEYKTPKEIKRRLTVGLIISLLVHAFVLSLQFGLPGIGLPGLEAPWSKRRAESPELTIQIVNPAPSSNAVESLPIAAKQPQEAKPENSETAPQPVATPVAQPVNERGESKSTTSGIRLVAPQKAEATPKPVVAKALSKARSAKKTKPDTPPLAQKRKTQMADVARLITQDIQREESFAVAVPSPDDLPKKADAEPDTKKQYDEIAQAGVEESFEEKAAKAQERELKRQKHEELMRKKADELAQQAVADGKEQLDQLGKQMEEDNRRQTEEASNRQAAALALEKQREAEEQSRRAQREAAAASAAEESRLAEQKRQDEERQLRTQQLQLALAQAQKDQQAKQQQIALEAEKRLQEEQRQQADLRQKQADELSARKKAEELAARQRADEAAARQHAEQVAQEQRAKAQAQAAANTASQVAASEPAPNIKNQSVNAETNPGQSDVRQNIANAHSTGNKGNENLAGNGSTQGNKSDPFVLPRNLSGGDLASRARDQVRGLDLLRGTPPVQRTDLEEKPQRRSLFGSQARDVPLRLYIDSWKQKIERNGNLNYSQFSKDRARGDPVVVVSIRSDGSVEDISIIRSSGRADIDEAVRRIVRLNAKYAAFPPNIAAQYDVIEIRRIWNFEDNLRLVEELR